MEKHIEILLYRRIYDMPCNDCDLRNAESRRSQFRYSFRQGNKRPAGGFFGRSPGKLRPHSYAAGGTEPEFEQQRGNCGV